MAQDGNYWVRRAAAGRVSRRRFVGGAAVAGVGAASLGLVGCGNDDDDTAAPTVAGASPVGTAAGSPSAAPAAAAPVPGGVLRTTEAAVYDSTDVHRAFGDPTSRLSNQTLNKLIQYKNPDTGEIQGDLANKWETPDAQTYTFTFNPGIKWHDGREFTSEDIRWHFERQASNKLKDGTEVSFRFNSIAKTITKIDTPDKNTVKLTLAAPNGSFLDFLSAFYSTVPQREATEALEADHRTLNEKAMTGTGPHQLIEWRAGKDVRYKKNPNYFKPNQPLLDGIVATVLFEDPNAQRTAFEQKQLDTWSSPDPSVTRSVISANKDKMYEILTGVSNTVFLSLNMTKQFKDIRLVKAMNMAMDRRGLIQTFHQGLGQVSGPVTWLQEGYAVKPTDLIKNPGYREDRALEIKEARDLWAAGGGPALGEIDIKIPDTWLARWPDTTQIIPKMFNDNLGVTQFKSTKTTYNEEIIPNLFNGNFPNWFGWTTEVTSPNPRDALKNTFLSTSGTNFNKVNNPDADKIINDFLGMTNLQQSVAKVGELQKILLDNAQYGQIILYNYIAVTARWNYYRGTLKAEPSAGKAATGYNLAAGHLGPATAWLDQKDPSFTGRPPATV